MKTSHPTTRRRLISAALSRKNLIQFSPWRDILVGNIVLVKLENTEDPVCVGRALTAMEHEPRSTYYRRFKVQLWEPCATGKP